MAHLSLSFSDKFLIFAVSALFILFAIFYLIFLVRATNTQINALDSRNNKKKAIPLLLVVWIPAYILVYMLYVYGFDSYYDYDELLLFNAGSIIIGIFASVLIHMSVTKPRRKTTIRLIELLLFLLFMLLFLFMPTVRDFKKLFYPYIWIHLITNPYLLVRLITWISPVAFDLIFLISGL